MDNADWIVWWWEWISRWDTGRWVLSRSAVIAECTNQRAELSLTTCTRPTPAPTQESGPLKPEHWLAIKINTFTGFSPTLLLPQIKLCESLVLMPNVLDARVSCLSTESGHLPVWASTWLGAKEKSPVLEVRIDPFQIWSTPGLDY